MLDWEFDELIEDIQYDMEEFNKTTDPRDLIGRSLDFYEDALEEGEIEKITAILSMFIVPFKNLIITTFDYNVLNKTIKTYRLVDKENFTNHQKEKLEEMVNFYHKNMNKIKIWGSDKDGEEIFYKVISDDQGNKKLVKI